MPLALFQNLNLHKFFSPNKLHPGSPKFQIAPKPILMGNHIFTPPNKVNNKRNTHYT